MFRFRKVLCIVLVCALVGVAYGAARKIRTFTTCSEVVTACAESPDADGMAIFNIHDGTGQEVQLMVTGFTPDTEYVVRLFDPRATPGNEPEQGTFITNGVGNGTFHRDIGTLLDWSCLRIYFCVQVGPTVECELRAQGCVG